jgi:hypothetical protein
MSENYFRTIYDWKCKYPDINHKEKLKEVLSDLRRQDLAEEIDAFSKDAIFYESEQLVGPTEALDTDDITMMSSNLAREYVHVVRFLGLHQRQIDQIESDHKRIRERIQNTLKDITTKKTITRQQICSALHYANQGDVIYKLNKKWKKSN